jgi:hypothetical protein
VDNQPIYIIDIAIGGQNGTYLYVLDKLVGVVVFKITFMAANSLLLIRMTTLGIIDARNGYIVKEKDN